MDRHDAQSTAQQKDSQKSAREALKVFPGPCKPTWSGPKHKAAALPTLKGSCQIQGTPGNGHRELHSSNLFSNKFTSSQAQEGFQSHGKEELQQTQQISNLHWSAWHLHRTQCHGTQMSAAKRCNSPTSHGLHRELQLLQTCGHPDLGTTRHLSSHRALQDHRVMPTDV